VTIRVKAWDAVFAEQERQWGEEGEDAQLNAEALAAAYLKHCYSSKRLAYTIAKCDEKTAAALNANNRNNDSSRKVIAKRRVDYPQGESNNRTLASLNTMCVLVRSSRQLATTAA
jgi:hypothetical protein